MEGPYAPTQPHLLQILIVVSFLHPLLQQGPQLTHVLQAELQSLEAADGCLAEHLPWGGRLKEKQYVAAGRDPRPKIHHSFLPSQSPTQDPTSSQRETLGPSIFVPPSLPFSWVRAEHALETPSPHALGREERPSSGMFLPRGDVVPGFCGSEHAAGDPPKRTPRVSPTSAWVYPRVILFCFRSLANCSRSFCRAFMSWDSI